FSCTTCYPIVEQPSIPFLTFTNWVNLNYHITNHSQATIQIFEHLCNHPLNNLPELFIRNLIFSFHYFINPDNYLDILNNFCNIYNQSNQFVEDPLGPQVDTSNYIQKIDSNSDNLIELGEDSDDTVTEVPKNYTFSDSESSKEKMAREQAQALNNLATQIAHLVNQIHYTSPLTFNVAASSLPQIFVNRLHQELSIAIAPFTSNTLQAAYDRAKAFKNIYKQNLTYSTSYSIPTIAPRHSLNPFVTLPLPFNSLDSAIEKLTEVLNSTVTQIKKNNRPLPHNSPKIILSPNNNNQGFVHISKEDSPFFANGATPKQHDIRSHKHVRVKSERTNKLIESSFIELPNLPEQDKDSNKPRASNKPTKKTIVSYKDVDNDSEEEITDKEFEEEELEDRIFNFVKIDKYGYFNKYYSRNNDAIIKTRLNPILKLYTTSKLFDINNPSIINSVISINPNHLTSDNNIIKFSAIPDCEEDNNNIFKVNLIDKLTDFYFDDKNNYNKTSNVFGRTGLT
ncbi:3019_t:CDS:2, partial [Dentiscutata heterogama]